MWIESSEVTKKVTSREMNQVSDPNLSKLNTVDINDSLNFIDLFQAQNHFL